MYLDIILGIVAGGMHIAAFVLYNRQMFAGDSKPNTASWTLWAFLTILNASSYTAMSNDWVKSILPITSSTACVITFLIALLAGKLSRLNPWEFIALAIGVISALVWWRFNSATYGNLILQLSLIISFIPTIVGVWENPKTEKAIPWFLWSAAYVFTGAVVILRWQGQLQDLAYPFNCLIFHAAVGFLARRN